MVERFIFLADKVVGLLVLFDYRVMNLGDLIVQLSAGKVFHDASPQRISQHIGGGTQAVPDVRGEKESDENRKRRKLKDKELLYICYQSMCSSKFGTGVSSVALHYASITFVELGSLSSLKLYNDI